MTRAERNLRRAREADTRWRLENPEDAAKFDAAKRLAIERLRGVRVKRSPQLGMNLLGGSDNKHGPREGIPFDDEIPF